VDDDTERWIRADRLLEAALDLPADRRTAYVAAAAAGDPELRRLVERLLESAETDAGLAPGGVFGGELFDGFAKELVAADEDPAGQIIGPYRVVREIGRGGTAVVYLAEGPDGARVAVKLIRLGLDTEEVLLRFDQERKILARAQHPNIAEVFASGVSADGRPYFAMEYVDGLPIDAYCDRRRATVADRLGLFLQAAWAVHHAHRDRVVHRDIKPSNILVTEDGRLKLLDFGIAKLLDAEAGPGAVPLTRSYARLMTPAFASPEQILGAEVTVATDVYQLGILLYLLLTGRWPYQLAKNWPGEVVRAITQSEPAAPSAATAGAGSMPPSFRGTPPSPEKIAAARQSTHQRLRRRLEGDLDRIALTALRKDPGDRYASVARMIDEIERHLAGRSTGLKP
jgi:eukaryotic-like serine/threonine-protein kinase